MAALREADSIHSVACEGDGGAHAAEVDQPAVDDDIADRPEAGLPEEGAVDGRGGAEPVKEADEALAPADAAGRHRGRDDNTPVVEVDLDDVERRVADAAEVVADWVGRGGRRQRQPDREQQPGQAAPQSRMSSRFQPKASS
jgi:hypothetical protein